MTLTSYSPELVRDGFFHKDTPQSIVDRVYAKISDESVLLMVDLTMKSVYEGGREAAEVRCRLTGVNLTVLIGGE